MALCLHPIEIRNPLYRAEAHKDGRPIVPGENTTDKTIVVPCGKCLNCRTARQNSWAYRMEYENLETVRAGGVSYFLTFTYDDDNLKYGDGIPTLCKQDVRIFHAKVRRSGVKFRFFTIGEYGGKLSRPHYHGMYFFHELLSRDEVHSIMYPIWNMCRPERFTVDPFSIKDAKYIAKYSLKSPHIDFDGVQPNFSLCSRQPGIGSGFLHSNAARQVVINQSYQVFDSGGTPYNLPRYYKQKLFTPLERSNIIKTWQDEELQRKFLYLGDISEIGKYEEMLYGSQLLDERYKVIRMSLDDFGKDCRVNLRDYYAVFAK